jgi:hypothetical protein
MSKCDFVAGGSLIDLVTSRLALRAPAPNLKKLNEYCDAKPAIGLITATNKLFGK